MCNRTWKKQGIGRSTGDSTKAAPPGREAKAIGDFLWGVRDSMPRGNASKIRVLNQHLYGLGVSPRGRLITLIYRFVLVAPSASVARSDL